MVTATAGAATADNTAAATATSAVKSTSQEDRFLRLLVAQMKNQDPLNPMDNAQVTTQMAQISTVSGIEKLNQTLQAFTQAQSFQAVGMIGRGVLAPGEFMDLVGGTALAGLDMPKAADSVKINIFNEDGSLVRTLDLGKKDAGVSMFAWDGKDAQGNALADGNYSFRVAATADGKTVTPTSLAVGEVSSVLMDKAGPTLSVSGMGQVDFSAVRQIL